MVSHPLPAQKASLPFSLQPEPHEARVIADCENVASAKSAVSRLRFIPPTLRQPPNTQKRYPMPPPMIQGSTSTLALSLAAVTLASMLRNSFFTSRLTLQLSLMA